MQHVQLHLAALRIGDRDLPVRHGTLMVVQRAECSWPDWEIVVHTLDEEPIAAGAHQATFTAVTGADPDGLRLTEMHGSVFLVRRVAHAIVLRGDSALAGFDPDLLEPPDRFGPAAEG